MYKFVNEGLRSTFPNVETILKIFLTMPISNASAERSFSVLKRIKNYLRSTMHQNKTSNLSLLFIESDTMDSINYEDIIDIFAKTKARKKI